MTRNTLEEWRDTLRERLIRPPVRILEERRNEYLVNIRAALTIVESVIAARAVHGQVASSREIADDDFEEVTRHLKAASRCAFNEAVVASLPYCPPVEAEEAPSGVREVAAPSSVPDSLRKFAAFITKAASR